MNQHQPEDTMMPAPTILDYPPDRTQPLDDDERAKLTEAYANWNQNAALLDSYGNYRLKTRSTPIAPWNLLVKRLFASNEDFQRAAAAFKTGTFVDPTQTTRFVSYGNVTTVAVATQNGPALGTVLATVSKDTQRQVPLADLIADALAAYVRTPAGRKAVEAVLTGIGT